MIEMMSRQQKPQRPLLDWLRVKSVIEKTSNDA
jgi:hypothetical protein